MSMFCLIDLRSSSPTSSRPTRIRIGSVASRRSWSPTSPPWSRTSTPRSHATPAPIRSSPAARPRSIASRARCSVGSTTYSKAATTTNSWPAAGGSARGTSRSAWTRSTPTWPCLGSATAWCGSWANPGSEIGQGSSRRSVPSTSSSTSTWQKSRMPIRPSTPPVSSEASGWRRSARSPGAWPTNSGTR